MPESWKAPEHFDGNSDWATNFPPKCDSRVTQIGINQFASIPLSCTDPDFGFGKEPPTPTADSKKTRSKSGWDRRTGRSAASPTAR